MKKILCLLFALLFILCACTAPSPTAEGVLSGDVESQDFEVSIEDPQSEILTSRHPVVTVSPTDKVPLVTSQIAPTSSISSNAPSSLLPNYDSLFYDSVQEFMAGLLSPYMDGVAKDLDAKENNNGVFRKFINGIKNSDLYVPYYQGKEIEFRNREEFFNIYLAPAGAFNHQPKIWFYPRDQIHFLTVFYLDSKISNNAAGRKCSEILREIAPTAPNVDNYEQFKSIVDYTRIYDSELQLSGRKVKTLVEEISTEKNVSVSFVYDEVYVQIEVPPETLAGNYFKDLSFKKVPVK